MSSERSAMLLARLQLRAPDARSILLAAPTSSLDVSQLAEELDARARHVGLKSRLLRVDAEQQAHPDASGEPATDDDLASPERARARVSSPEGLTIVIGKGVLDSAATLVVASVADAVLLAARRGKTSRQELREARDEVERAGGRIVGAVLLK